MLSGISHDLRTPLTRLKLQLAMLKQQDMAKKMGDDIEEMERMLNEYLEFSRHQKNEDTEIVDVQGKTKRIKEPNIKFDLLASFKGYKDNPIQLVTIRKIIFDVINYNIWDS